jgi:2-keto-4-pentenoate hydratase
MDQSAVAQAAELLVAARRTGKLLDALPDACKPRTLEDAFAIQDATLAALGETVAGWKAAIVDGRAVRAPIMASHVFESGVRVNAATMPLLGIEAEIAFRFARDLPPGKHSYEDVAAAVSAFAAIEIVDSRFRDHQAVSAQERNADFVTNGGFVRGAPATGWRKLDLTTIAVTLTIGGEEIVKRNGGHAAGDPLLPAVALANDLPGGIRAGQFVTTGTYTGLTFAKPGQTVVAAFAGFGPVEAAFV